MKTSKRISIVAALVCIAVLLFTGCEQIESVKKATSNEADILETAYFYDEDTDAYRTVLIIQNNTLNPIKMGFVVAKAFDENGERIEEVKEGPYNYALMGTYYWLGTNEKTALIFTNDGIAGKSGYEFNSILDHFTAVPAALEWEHDGASKQDPNQLPHGLSLAGIEPYVSDVVFEGDYAEYMATIHNDSDIDYTFDNNKFEYVGGGKHIEFVIAAVYRDAEGKICDLQEIKYTGLGGMPDLAAGSDTELYFMADHTVKDESLTPEYYISITNLTGEEGE